MKYTEELLKKYGIITVSAIGESGFKPRIIIKHVDSNEYSYYISGTLTESAIDEILEKHIKKYYIYGMRKEKLQRLDENR